MGYIKLALYKIFSYDKIPSTQTTAQELIASRRTGDHCVVVASAQSAGRGRFRRTWVSHHGNLYASFILNQTAAFPWHIKNDLIAVSLAL